VNIRFLEKHDFDNLMLLIRQGFPNRTSEEEKIREEEILSILSGQRTGKFIGVCDEHDSILSALQIYDFDICFRGEIFKFGGVGRVVTGFINKKRGFARRLIDYAISYFKQNDYLFCGLYPFNINYYRKMGFGYGSENYVFSIQPHTFISGNITGLRYLKNDDISELDSFYDRYSKTCHGMLRNPILDVMRFYSYDGVIVHDKYNEIDGYLCYNIEKSWFDGVFSRDLVVTEYIVTTNDAQSSFSSFFFAQQDQFNRIRLHVQDQWLFFLSDDCDSGENKAYDNGIQEYAHYCGGILYYIIDEKKYIQHILNLNLEIKTDFLLCLELFDNRDESILTKISILLSEKGSKLVDAVTQHDCSLRMSKADFASWSFGVVTLNELINTLRALLDSPNYENELQNIFGYKDKPKCVTYY
jgi:hypothetical protein